ncbi:MAG: hypothetical protein ACQGVC_10665 [Myxococcota bacterium]
MKAGTIVPMAVLGAVLVLFTSGAAQAEEQPNPYTKSDGTWISISGQVKNIGPDTFVLDYGTGSVLVEMDDGDRDADAYQLIAGDKVTVNGRIDDDFYETTKIEAGSVFVEKIDTYFFASARDEEQPFYYEVTTPVVVSSTVVRGTVTEVNGSEFIIDTGVRSVRVDVEDMAYDPLDDEGYLKVRPGDRVRVVGTMEDGFFESRELKADSIVKLAS